MFSLLSSGVAHINLTPVIAAVATASLPVVARWAARNAWAEAKSLLSPYMSERTLTMFQQRFDGIADKAIAFGVASVEDRLTKGAPIAVDVKGAILGAAVNYIAQNAPDTATQAGDLMEKVLARFDLHPAVRAVVEAAPNP